MRYSFNISKLLELLLAKMFHKPLHLKWLSSGLKPLKTTYSVLMALRAQKLAEATINSSVNRLTTALNDHFETDEIYLVHQLDYVDGAYEYLATDIHYEEFDYTDSEKHSPADYDYFSDEYDPDYDFIVRVPDYLTYRINEIKAFVAKFTMAGRRFNIEITYPPTFNTKQI